MGEELMNLLMMFLRNGKYPFYAKIVEPHIKIKIIAKPMPKYIIEDKVV